jgi:hypothetical protein
MKSNMSLQGRIEIDATLCECLLRLMLHEWIENDATLCGKNDFCNITENVTTALQHENVRVDSPTTPYSLKDLIVPLFINCGEDFLTQNVFSRNFYCCVSRALSS